MAEIFRVRVQSPNAKRTYVGDRVTINADVQTNGNGGKVVIWSDEVTGFYGQINARGGIESGDGGSVEVSSKEHLIFRGKVDTSAVNRLPGTLFLDPTNIIIADGSGDEAEDGTDTFAGNNSEVVGSILTTSLGEIDDTAPTTIYESELEGLSGDTNIILNATNNITLQDLSDDGLNLAAGEGAIAFSADADGDGVGDFVMEDNAADTIFTNGRDITLSGTNLTLGNIGTFQQGGNTGDAGDITSIADESISATNGVFIGSATFGAGNAGDINIQAETLSVTNGAFVDASTFGQGNGGAIAINATEFITLSGKDSQGFGSGIFSQVNSSGQGMAGSITIDTGSLSITDGAQVDASIFGQGNVGAIEVEDSGAIAINATGEIFLSGQDSQGNPSGIFSKVNSSSQGTAGSITVDTGSLSITDGAQVSASTVGVGNAGAIAITATDVISLSGGNITGILSQVNSEAEGTAGGIIINTGSLSLFNRAQVNASTFGVGDAGAITITATDDISLSGEDSQGELSGIFSAVASGAEGTAGGISIDTGSLSLSNGAQVNASTFGVGDAGAITITATDAIALEGKSSQELFVSGIFSQVEAGAEGTAVGISIDTESLFLTNGAVVSAKTEGDGKAGDIGILVNTLEATSGSQIKTNTTTNFDAADINLEISDNLLLSGTGSGLFAQTEGAGKAGNIVINSPQLTQGRDNGGTITVDASQAVLLTDNSELTVETSDAGQPGDISITTPNLTIGKDAEISATATKTSTNTERGGSITVNVSNLDLTGKLGIFAETQGVAPAGTLNIQPDDEQPNLDIQFTDTALISASTRASGAGGDINLTAPETINIAGQGKVAVETTGTGDAGSINITTQNFNISQETEISASTFSSGRAGNINIAADKFNLTEGVTVITDTTSSGQAGDIQLQIKDNLNLVDSAIAASTESNSTGQGGSINIDPQVVILNNSQIAVNSQGEGTGGNITMQADNLTLDNQSAIDAETLSTDGGNIEIALGENLILRENSQISATAGTAQAGGDGGNIEIDAQFILAFPTEDSNITANAFFGNGGNISITAEGILGLEFREQSTIFSDITATSEFGLAGTVNINTLETDPNRKT